MKIATKLLACAALSASLVAANQVANAAAPQIKGTYKYVSVRFCQIGVVVNKDLQGDVIDIGTVPGASTHMRSHLGTATFTGAAPNSGNVAVSLRNIGGTQFYINSGAALTQSTETGTGVYSNTASAINLAGEAGPAMYSDIVGGIARTVDFVVRQESNRCFESGTLTRVN